MKSCEFFSYDFAIIILEIKSDVKLAASEGGKKIKYRIKYMTWQNIAYYATMLGQILITLVGARAIKKLFVYQQQQNKKEVFNMT